MLEMEIPTPNSYVTDRLPPSNLVIWELVHKTITESNVVFDTIKQLRGVLEK
jgi:hypothetical protein